jgi:hypothetical protein
MGALSVSFTLGKASEQHGANVEHNNREFIASNVDPAKTGDNVTYVRQDVRDAYEELFGRAAEEYNARQKQPCRRIDDYYGHITNSKREEAFYEIVVQFGDSKAAPVGSEQGEAARRMLDEYIRGFRKRNPNLYIFNAVLHMDEASPHLHINVIPFYTKERKNGLSKGVSMKAALDEQGFTAKNFMENRLVAWEDSEREVMAKILERNGYEREEKNIRRPHLTVDQYKELQDERRFHQRRKLTEEDLAEQNVMRLESENATLKAEKEKLAARIHSPWKSFFYSSPDKQAFVRARLDGEGIPYRETDNGFEAQECYVALIRKLEKDYRPAASPQRNTLRDTLDRLAMQSGTFGEMTEKLKASGYEVKEGKYLSVRPQYAGQYIRLRTLGEDYSEQAIRNRITNGKRRAESVEERITKAKNQDSLEVCCLKTVRHYTLVFAQGALPMRKKNPKKPFTWDNDAELDKLSALNKRVNEGATMESLRKSFEQSEATAKEKEDALAQAKAEEAFFANLRERARVCFEDSAATPAAKEKAMRILAEHNITRATYHRLDGLIGQSGEKVAALERETGAARQNLKENAELFTLAEKVAAGTWVQSLVTAESHRRRSDILPGGVTDAR